MEQRNIKARPSLPLGSIMMRAAGVLLCLVLFSIHLMGGLYARYTSGSFAEDEARVARFDVTVTGDASGMTNVTCAVNPHDSRTVTVKIENTSEVAVRYAIMPQLKTPIEGVTLDMDQDTGTLAPGASSPNHIMTLNVNWAEFTDEYEGAAVSVTAEYSIAVRVEQMD